MELDPMFIYPELNSDMKKAERKQIRKLGMYFGSAIILMIVLQEIMLFILQKTGLYYECLKNATTQLAMEMLISVVSLLIPFFTVRLLIKKQTFQTEPLPLEKPDNGVQFLLAIPAGLGICMIANRVTTYIVVIMNVFGIELSSPDIPTATGVFGVFMSFLRVSVAAAMVEELCLRGVVMQSLRKYGDWFAIVMSGIVFGLMHCNLIQAPFALIVGIGLGYFSIKTNSLWTGIAIHSLNNALSMVLSYVMESMDIKLFTPVYSAVVYSLTFIGMICLVIFVIRQKRIDIRGVPTRTFNSFAGKTGAFLSSPFMIMAIIAISYFTVTYIKLK